MSSVLVGGSDAAINAAQAAALVNSSKYRAYVASVDKALKAFETTNEWADLISALGKLSRVFHSNAKFGDIPKPITVAKRLSQCLHPALPHGVHLKALETYRQIFDILGQKDLSRLLYLFSVGLFPLMDHCGIKVKSELLSIFEQYLLPLGENLKPSLPGFITALLLGLEEGTEFFERSSLLLNQVQDIVGSETFFACLWEAILGSPSVRLSALIYVNAKFDRRKPMDDQLYIMGNNVDHMIAALCATADDDGSTLVQRHLLDFLSAAFPLNSDYLMREDFVQLLRRCVFVILRRDMSLNRRLYQWILNRSGDSSVGALPIGGVDEQLDTTFFRTYALPLIKDAIEEYLRLNAVEIAVSSANWDGGKERQLQFTEVRVCRLLLYFLDRPELGNLVLEETLSMLLMFSAEQDDQLKSAFDEMLNYEIKKSSVYYLHSMTIGKRRELLLKQASIFSNRSEATISSKNNTESDQAKRLNEFAKVLNLLLNSLDIGFIWNFLSYRLEMLLNPEVLVNTTDSLLMTNETLYLKDEARRRNTEELQKFPLIILFCLNIVELDFHSAIREIHLPSLLLSLLSNLRKNVASEIDINSLLSFISVARVILFQINHSILDFEGTVRTSNSMNEIDLHGSKNSSPFHSESSVLSSVVKEQGTIESSLKECQRLLAKLCSWYCVDRSVARLKVFLAISTLQMEFADFPIYSLSTNKSSLHNNKSPHIYPEWLKGLFDVIFLDLWLKFKLDGELNGLQDVNDFFARAVAFDLFFYIYARTVSLFEQYSVINRKEDPFDVVATDRDKIFSRSKATTTVLLKSVLSESNVNQIEKDEIFQKATRFAWAFLDSSFNEISAKILLLLHSRQINEPSSEVEDLIIAHLTSSNKSVSGAAARKFRILWTISRFPISNNSYPGLSFKPFNRIIMFLLGILTDDSVSYEKAELKNLAANWFNDCAKHNDLPKILQVFAVMLLNPTTCRISIQYLSMNERFSKEQMPNMPVGICLISLLAESGRHSLYHLCEDISVSERNIPLSTEISLILERLFLENDFPSWFNDLKNRLLQVGDTNHQLDVIESKNSHKRTISDIPIFDEDNDSLSGLSIDSVDHDVVDALQYVVDSICAMYGDADNQLFCSFDETGQSKMTSHARDDYFLSENNFPVCIEQSASATISHSNCKTVNSVAPTKPKISDVSTVLADNIKRIKSGHRRQDSLQESIFTMSAQELKLFDTSELPRMNTAGDEKQSLCHELHAHMLLYAESGRTVDLGRVEKVFRMLIALLRIQRGFMASRMIVSCMVSSGITSLPKPSTSSIQLIDLLSKHIRAILGQEFWSSNDVGSDSTKNKHYTFLELFITVSLYFLRSYYLNSPTALVTDDDLRIAWKCKMAALDFLSEIIRELISMIRDNQSRSLVAFIHGILQRSKLQKCLLHLLLTSVHNIRSTAEEILPLSVDILEFNEGPSKYSDQFADLFSGYQSSLLDLTAVVIQLELDIKNGFQDFTDHTINGIYIDKLSINHQIYNSPQHRSTLREPHVGMVELRMFLLTVLNALKHNPFRHEQWQLFIVQILPFLDRSLPTFSIHIVEQLCKNIESSVNTFFRSSDDLLSTNSQNSHLHNRDSIVLVYPPNYIIIALETLTTFIHYCLIDNASVGASGSTMTNAHVPSSAITSSLSSSMMSVIPGTKGATELISNLVKVFSFGDSTSMATNASINKFSERANGGSWKLAKDEMLNAFPHILATICDVWTLTKDSEFTSVGSTSQIRRLILELASPVVQYHQQAFFSALSFVWLAKASSSSHNQLMNRVEPDQSSFEYSSSQLDIADLLSNIKNLPFENLVSCIADSLKECAGKTTKNIPFIEKQNTSPSEVAMLEILHGYIRSAPPSSLLGCWSSLQILFTDAPIMNLPPKAVFILFIILADFVRLSGSTSIIEDKQMSRAVQDAYQKMIDAVNVIIGWQLEQTTWLKRTLVVKHDSSQKSQETSPVSEFATISSIATSETSSLRGSTSSLATSKLTNFETSSLGVSQQSVSILSSLPEKRNSSNLRSSLKDNSGCKRDPTYSTQALFLLAENLAELVDSICKSEDKERLLPSLHAVWANTLPYLKAKNARNARFFLASSQLLASISTFSYMRSVWRKSTLDLLLDPAFFKMDLQSLKQWLIVIDHLMTYDKTSFKELLARISTTPNSTLSSLITSKEAEYDMRAQALKRLAFIVLSSELDQYNTQLPDIQERLSENLRLSQVPNVHSQVFLCYRVLLIRMRPDHLVSMWPSMVTELIHVLLQIEQQLTGTANVSDDLKCDRNDQWMQLYLAACKLLETLCTLPSGYIAQFQMCHWAFVTSITASNSNFFIPFAGRIERLLRTKYGNLTSNERKLVSASLMNVKTLTSFSELRCFFLALANQNKYLSVGNQLNFDRDGQLRDACYMNGTLSYKNAISRLEHSLYIDFAEHWQL